MELVGKFALALIQLAFSFVRPLPPMTQTQEYLLEHGAVWVIHPTLKKPDGSPHQRTCFIWPEDVPYDAGPPPDGCPDQREVFCWDSQVEVHECVMGLNTKQWLQRAWTLPPPPVSQFTLDFTVSATGNPPQLAIVTDAPISTTVGQYHFHISTDGQKAAHIYNKQPQVPGGTLTGGNHTVSVQLAGTVVASEHPLIGQAITRTFTISDTAPSPTPPPEPEPDPIPPPATSLTPVLIEEFNGLQGTSPNPSIWTVFNEKDHDFSVTYFKRDSRNISLTGAGTLMIRAFREPTPDPTRDFSSGQMRSYPTPGNVNFSFGGQDWVWEWRIRHTNHSAVWIAMWGMGDKFTYVTPPPSGMENWKMCREIDVMESFLEGPGCVTGTAISPGFSGLPRGKVCGVDTTQWHTYLVRYDHEDKTLTWFMDGNQYHVRSVANIPDWGFERRFTAIADLSIKTNVPDSLTEAYLEIDWMKFWKQP